MDDSADEQQEPIEPDAQASDDAVDSLASGQEHGDTGTDNSAERLNGLMALVGKRTTEVSEQKARADRAEAVLAEYRERLLAYEAGARMSDADALATEQAAGLSTDNAEQVPDDSTDTDADPYAGANAGFDYWGAGVPYVPDGGAVSTYVDPNHVSRAQSMPAHRPTNAQRLRAAFDSGIDSALSQWGWEPKD